MLNSNSSGSNNITFVLGILIGCGVTLTLQRLLSSRRQLDRGDIGNNDNIINKDGNNNSNNNIEKRIIIPDMIREEQLSRHILYFGKDGVTKLQKCKICVVGVGGVGSHVVHMLSRSGIYHIRIIDYDQITLSSLNRHTCATLSDVGISKVTCLKNYIQKICPDTNHLYIEAYQEMYTKQTSDRLLSLPNNDKWDMILDCIDDIPTKAVLLQYCIQNNIPVISCMGAGGKADPTRLHISDLRSAAKDPLATKLRQTMKQVMLNDEQYLDDMDQLAVIYSSEKTVVKLANFTTEQIQQGVHKYGAVDGMRIRIVPVLGTMPAIMGQAIASYALTKLAVSNNNNNKNSYVMQPIPTERIGRNARHKIYQTLRTREQQLTTKMRKEIQQVKEQYGDDSVSITPTASVHGQGELVKFYNNNNNNNNGVIIKEIWIGEIQIDSYEDTEYLLEIWRNRCAVTQARLGTVMHLIRWDYTKPTVVNNLVLVSAHVMQEYELNPDLYKTNKINNTIRTNIEKRLQSCRIDRYIELPINY